ncbi:MAG: hypothetical protein II012_05195, partial [Ruminococcus sp.]|nr:hypothetical protein [Ruminococcus sp.]
TNDEKSAEAIVPRRLQTSREGQNFRRCQEMKVTEGKFKDRQLQREGQLQQIGKMSGRIE